MIAESNFVHRSPEARGNAAWAIGNPGAYVTQWVPQAIKLAQAHALSRGAGVRVAVLDTGIDVNHPLLAGRLLPGKDFVDGDTTQPRSLA
jgi:thermitase